MEFGAIQIIGGIIMLICSILIIVITIMQEQKQQDMSSALSGQANDNFFGKGNVSSSREQALARLTKLLAIIFFVATIAVNVVPAIIDKVKNAG